MYQYQQSQRFFAQVAHSMESLGLEELAALGATDLSEAYRGIYFNADQATLYRINYGARLITRVLAPLTAFQCHNPDYLYRSARLIPWTDFLGVDDTFAVFANVSNSKIRHSKYAALRIKDAIVDTFREQQQRRPSIDTRDPDVWISLHIDNNQATISLDTSGGSLHRRGYRASAVEAPMQETVAAAIVRLSGWEGETPLYDPMCGSGTLLAEALMHYCRIPAGYLRSKFGFERLPDFSPKTWEHVRQEAQAAMRPLPPGLLAGSDISPAAISMTRTNLKALPYGNQVTLKVCDFRALAPLTGTTILCNPPYGVRMKSDLPLEILYGALGDFLKQRCTGSTAYVYAGEREMLKYVGLRTTWKKPLISGSLDGRLARYDLY